MGRAFERVGMHHALRKIKLGKNVSVHLYAGFLVYSHDGRL